MSSDSHKHENRLAKEQSPYLLQHAHNPVDWYAWGDEAFERARTEDKPIFLSIGYATCHWCHVMEDESFEDETIARLMNENFINIKVDREERPDIDQIYMTAIQAMTGAGGWPLSAFLTPDRKPFYGGTYFPPDRRHGRPGFPDILREISRLWQEDRKRVLDSGQQITGAIEQGLQGQAGPVLDEAVLKTYFFHAQHLFDPEHGGFGQAPKFPRSDSLSLLMRIYRRTGEQRAWKMVRKTLDAMARGGIYDHLGGGFHRYATDGRWLIPHFEKMLYDNALLAQTYLEAYQLDGDDMWAGVAREILEYALRDMVSAEGGFYSAEDADSEGEEGKFYVWSETELQQVLSDSELKLFKGLIPLTVAGMLEGNYVLHMGPEVPWSNRYLSEFEEIRKKLFEARKQRVPPFKDDKILASWNGMMISACAKGGRILADTRYVQAAQAAADFILTKLWDGKTLSRRYRSGETRFNGSLDDYSFVVAGLLDLYETDFNFRWFEAAVSIQKQLDALFWDETNGAYFFTDASDGSLITRTKEIFDGAVPSGNSIAAMNLLRLHHYTLDNHYRERWEKLLQGLSGRIKDNPQIAPALLLALDFATDHTPEIVIADLPSDPKVISLLEDLNKQFLPNKVLAIADSVEAEHQKKMPIIEGKVPLEGEPTLYICENNSCQRPVHQLADAGASLEPRRYPLE